jgi:hypothetical protein
MLILHVALCTVALPSDTKLCPVLIHEGLLFSYSARANTHQDVQAQNPTCTFTKAFKLHVFAHELAGTFN